jgi:ankyrin repeat protein
MKGHIDIVNVLISYKADPTKSDADGKTPLHKVRTRQHNNI